MSLLSGMNDMLYNEAAMEAAADMNLFEEEIALEADELIDIMVDGDDIDEMEEEDEDLDDEYDSVSEAALTDEDFLNSLNLNRNDPITTHAGSIGQQSSTATFSGNYSNSFFDDNDPISTEYGALGQSNSSANPSNNYGGTVRNTSDNNTTRYGSIGQQNSIAKDPTMESIMFFADLSANYEAMEGIRDIPGNIKNKVGGAIDNMNQRLTEKKAAKRMAKCNLAGVKPIDSNKLGKLIGGGNFDAALNMVKGYVRMLEQAKSSAEEEPDSKKKVRALKSLIKTNSSLMINIEKEKKVYNKMAQGKSKEQSTQEAFTEIIASLDSIYDPAEEAYISDCINMVIAFEQESNPEFTAPGSVGQRDSAANFSRNYSDGFLDDEDPIEAEAGSEGLDSSYASFEENYGGGRPNVDPYKTYNGSVGQKDSTARDPVIESTLDDELDILNDSLLDDFDEYDY